MAKKRALPAAFKKYEKAGAGMTGDAKAMGKSMPKGLKKAKGGK